MDKYQARRRSMSRGKISAHGEIDRLTRLARARELPNAVNADSIVAHRRLEMSGADLINDLRIRRVVRGTLNVSIFNMLKLSLLTPSDGRVLLAENDGEFTYVQNTLKTAAKKFPKAIGGFLGQVGIFGAHKPYQEGVRFVSFTLDEESAERVKFERRVLLGAIGAQGVLTSKFEPHISLLATRDHSVAVALADGLNSNISQPIPFTIGSVGVEPLP